jgi:hypothetical protein
MRSTAQPILLAAWLLLGSACAQGAAPDYEQGDQADTERPGKVPEQLNNATPAANNDTAQDMGGQAPADTGAPDTESPGDTPDLTPDLPVIPQEDSGAPDLPPEEVNTGPTDNDNDSWYSDEDCDDNNPQVSPNSPELCGDNLDNNCDGQVDEGCDAPQGGDIGATCSADGQCDLGICLMGWPGNYCTGLCDSDPCPSGSACLAVQLQNGTAPLCLRNCAGRGDCRQDQACFTVDAINQVCIPACFSDNDCQQGSCDPVTGLCQ